MSNRLRWGARAAVLLAALVAWTGSVGAQLPMGPATQFDITGFLQDATLNTALAGTAQAAIEGGTLTVNGHVIVVPARTIVILPANALTWQELFAQAPAPYGLGAPGRPMSGLAMNDIPAPLTTYEVQVVGNRVQGSGGCPANITPVDDCYIAGLIYLSQQGLNSGSGFINWIDYTVGEMRVGGLIGDSTTGTRVRINDPVGRYGRSNTPDPRFTVDPDNPTIKSGTGFPMCLPRTDPAGADDPLCPQGNRPAGQIAIQMNDPVHFPGVYPDATKQAPMEIGDFVIYAGTMVSDNAAMPTAGPWPANGVAGTYISAHTIEDNIAIYTWPGTNPAYVSIDVTIMGTGGLTVVGAGEAAIRTRFEGMTTDWTRRIHLYGVDTAVQADGSVTTSDRDYGYIGIDPGAAGGLGAVQGRWRFRPPCLSFGTLPDPRKPVDRQCVYGPLNGFLPPPREARAVLEAIPGSLMPDGVTPVPNAWNYGDTTLYANGLIAGQYHAPILEYIFGENIPGSPIVENNFQSIPFLSQGGYASTAGTTITGPLSPWPGDPATAPAPVPLVPPPPPPPPPPPVVNPVTAAITATPTTNVAPGSTLTLTANAAGGSGTYLYNWSCTSNAGSFCTPINAATATFVPAASGVAYTQQVVLTVTDAADATRFASANATISVSAVGAPSITGVTTNPASVVSGFPVTITVNATTPDPAAPNMSVAISDGQGGTAFATASRSMTCNTATTPVSCTAQLTVTPVVAASTQLAMQVVVTDNAVQPALSSTGTAPLNVSTIAAPVVTAVTPSATSVLTGTAVSLLISATTNNPVQTNLTVTVTDAAGLTLTAPPVGPGATVINAPLTCNAGNCSANVTVVHRLAAGQVVPDTLRLNVVAKDVVGGATISSASFSVAPIVVSPLPDALNITLAEYRVGKNRLSINATSTANNGAVVVKLLPYVTNTGVLYDPDPAHGGLGNVFTYQGAGLYLLDLVGAPMPANPPATPLVVVSSLNGRSPNSGLTRIR